MDMARLITKGIRKKVIIICPEHGEFKQVPSGHLQGKGCLGCRINDRADKKTVGNENFIERSNIIHNNLYGYGKVEYKNE